MLVTRPSLLQCSFALNFFGYLFSAKYFADIFIQKDFGGGVLVLFWLLPSHFPVLRKRQVPGGGGCLGLLNVAFHFIYIYLYFYLILFCFIYFIYLYYLYIYFIYLILFFILCYILFYFILHFFGAVACQKKGCLRKRYGD